jgi:molybdate transport system substrate-binding protein
MELDLLSAGAAKGLVEGFAPALRAATGAMLRAEFGAVGAIGERLEGGAACDVVVLTASMIDALAGDGRVVPDTVAPLGRVRTGVAVRIGDAPPAIANREALRRSLLAASRLFVPDPLRSTAGVHFIRVLRALGVHDAVMANVHAFPNGAIAMRELGQADGPGCLGCTQITEINYTPGVALVGPLTAEFELATVYSVAVTTCSRQPAAARAVARLLAGPESCELRRSGGFEA